MKQTIKACEFHVMNVPRTCQILNSKTAQQLVRTLIALYFDYCCSALDGLHESSLCPLICILIILFWNLPYLFFFIVDHSVSKLFVKEIIINCWFWYILPCVSAHPAIWMTRWVSCEPVNLIQLLIQGWMILLGTPDWQHQSWEPFLIWLYFFGIDSHQKYYWSQNFWYFFKKN